MTKEQALALGLARQSRDLAPLYGLIGGPAAARLPLPALADVRTVTWPVRGGRQAKVITG